MENLCKILLPLQLTRCLAHHPGTQDHCLQGEIPKIMKHNLDLAAKPLWKEPDIGVNQTEDCCMLV